MWGTNLYELALFAGAGGGILGGILCGHTCIGACEIEKYPRDVLLARQRDGQLPIFPIWDDICTFRSDNPECREYFDYLRTIKDELVITGGFPCQDISAAGKGKGITGERSGLWKEFGRIIGEVRPARVLVENSPMLTIRGLGVVLGDLAEMGYYARWGVLGADDAGAPHRRKRIWIVAYAQSEGLEGFGGSKSRCDESRWITPESERQTYGRNNVSWWDQDPADVGNSIGNTEGSTQRKGYGNCKRGRKEPDIKQWNEMGGDSSNAVRIGTVKPVMGRLAHGVAKRVDRLKAIGNGQVPAVVRIAWDILDTDRSEAYEICDNLNKYNAQADSPKEGQGE